jgi:hypothetical protein
VVRAHRGDGVVDARVQRDHLPGRVSRTSRASCTKPRRWTAPAPGTASAT